MPTKYKVHLHPIPYEYKPNSVQVASLSKTITSHTEELTAQELAEKLAQGHTVVLGLMNGERKKANFISQQVLMLDFDNKVGDEKAKGDDYVTIADILADDWFKANAAFIYKTFSYQKDWEKFRVVFLLDQPLTKHEDVTEAYKWLMKAFPQADPSTKDCSRLFYGGEEYIEINFDNTLTIPKKKGETQSTTHTHQSSHHYPKTVKPLTKRQSSQMIRAYIEREKDNLQDYGNALSAITVIAKAALVGEIDEESAREYVKLLAMDKHIWEAENELKLNEFLGKRPEDIYTNYTFRQKFGAGGKGKSDFDVFEYANEFIERYQVVYYNQALFFRTGVSWSSSDNKLLRLVDQEVNLKRSADTELLHQLIKKAPLIEEEILNIQLKNDYRIEGGKVKEGAVEDFTPYLLDVAYDPKAYDQTVDDFLNFLVKDRQDLRLIIEELLGHIIMLQGFPHKVFFLVGEKGGNGKSTFLEMLNNFVGELGSNINLENFKDHTSVASLEGKLVNIGDDIDASYMEKSQIFKTLASGNKVALRPIYKEPFTLKNRATLIFTANDMPVFKDKTGGIERRLVILPCDNVVKTADFEIDKKLSSDQAKSYILNLALQGLERIRRNGGKLSESETLKHELESYMEDSDTVLSYINNKGIDPNMDRKMVYSDYVQYCAEIGQTPHKAIAFGKRLKAKGYETRETRRAGVKMFLYEKVDA